MDHVFEVTVKGSCRSSEEVAASINSLLKAGLTGAEKNINLIIEVYPVDTTEVPLG